MLTDQSYVQGKITQHGPFPSSLFSSPVGDPAGVCGQMDLWCDSPWWLWGFWINQPATATTSHNQTGTMNCFNAQYVPPHAHITKVKCQLSSFVDFTTRCHATYLIRCHLDTNLMNRLSSIQKKTRAALVKESSKTHRVDDQVLTMIFRLRKHDTEVSVT